MDSEAQASKNLVSLSGAPLWEYVPFPEYKVPDDFSTNIIWEKWNSLIRTLFRGEENSNTPAKLEADLSALPEVRLKHLVGPVDWNSVADALDVALGEWGQTSHQNPFIKLVIGQPYCGNEEILQIWGTRHKANLVKKPTHDQILCKNNKWLESFNGMDSLWVLPYLEHCYLRRYDGLGLIREFLEKAFRGELGCGLIGCDSWAWAYLQRIWPVPQLDTLTLQAFDGERLSQLLINLASQAIKRGLWFRNSETGKAVLTIPTQASEKISPEIHNLAVHCRGNFGVARSYWKERLRAEPETDESNNAAAEEVEENKGGKVETVWVSEKLEENILPSEMDDNVPLILHSLLLHNGLSARFLSEFLLVPEHRAMSVLLRLKSWSLVSIEDERWKVTSLSYPVVRKYLEGAGFLLDEF